MEDALRPAQIEHLDRAACFALLATQVVGRLVVPGSRPIVAPVNYVLVDECLVFRSEEGSGPGRAIGAVVFEVDDVDDSEQGGWSVIVRGVVEAVEPTTDDELHQRLVSWAPGRKDQWRRLRVEEITGRLLRGAERPWPLPDRGYL